MLRLSSLSPSLALALAATACRAAPVAAPSSGAAADDPTVATVAIDARLDRIEAALAELTGDTAGKLATPEARLARLEQRLDKVTGFLKQAVRPELDATKTYAIPVDPLDPVIGPADAKVTIVEAYEFMCPYCAMVAPSLDALLQGYPREVRLVSKYFLIHGERAMPSGVAACAAAKQGKYPAMKKALWASIWPKGEGHQSSEQALTAEGVEKIAKQVGLDLKRYRDDLAACGTWVERSGQTLQQFGAGGTPTFYINGKSVGGQSAEDLRALIDAEITKVDAAVSAGVKPGRYYTDVVLKQGEAQAVMSSPFD